MNFAELIKSEVAPVKAAVDSMSSRIRVAMPGIIKSFDVKTQTASVQPALRERINLKGVLSWVDLPLLPDVPVILFRAKDYVLTFPISEGDECLLVFGDMCIDAWWQSGDVQNQVEKRRHDLSDAFAIVGLWSQPRVIEDYSEDTVQLRNEDGTTYVELDSDGETINVVS